MSQELADLFVAHMASQALGGTKIGRVEIEYDDDGERFNIDARHGGDGKRLRRVKVRDNILRSIYYYDDATDVVRKDKFFDDGTLSDLEQRRRGNKQGSQLRFRSGRELWRHRFGNDRASEQWLSLPTDAVQFELLLGPAPGSKDAVCETLLALAWQALERDPKLGSRERTIVFEVDNDGSNTVTTTIVIDKKKPQTFESVL